ncbi:MbnP family protein [uncultured Winogradskyella sp.]|uniref:MbnP family protein n=1 Tax=uncultured Winogradskyella sp. TaxID=395353 RepID=UPI0026066C64|nr:MbnP family protein [uncultured Winogradskyella sp.]
MKKIFALLFISLCFASCSDDDNNNSLSPSSTTLSFSHNWNGTPVTNADFNTIQFTNENGEMLSIERLRYLISDITFTSTSNEVLDLDNYNLIDLTNGTNLDFNLGTQIPPGNYSNVSFTFGFDNEDNSQNYLDLNSASFNVPDMLGGGYHYMQFDGKYLDSNNAEANFNYHAIRAVDNPGMNPTFPQDTFFTVNLGAVTISGDTTLNIEMNIAEWFTNPNTWDLNQLNTVLMPNSAAQIQIYQNGQSVFTLGSVSQ